MHSETLCSLAARATFRSSLEILETNRTPTTECTGPCSLNRERRDRQVRKAQQVTTARLGLRGCRVHQVPLATMVPQVRRAHPVRKVR